MEILTEQVCPEVCAPWLILSHSVLSLAFLQFPQWATSSYTHCSLPERLSSAALPSSHISSYAEMIPPGRQFFLVFVIFPGYLVFLS